MKRTTSFYLDLVRLLAAFCVMFGHLSWHQYTSGFLWQAAAHKGQSVTLFFVLSGFVIAYVTERETPKTYALARVVRIGSVAVPALVLTFGLDAIGRAINPAAYHALGFYRFDNQLWQAVAGGLFINQIWWLDMPVGSNVPYWSLGNEVWYYVVWGLFAYAPRLWRWPAITAALLVAGPPIVALLPVWLMGALAYHWRARGNPALFAAASVLLVWRLATPPDLPLLPWLTPHLPDFLGSMLLGAVFAAQLVGLHAMGGVHVPKRIAHAVRWAAGATFSIYLFHLPVAQFISAVTPFPPGTGLGRLVIIGGTIVAVFLLAEVTERRKAALRHAFLWLHRRYADTP